VLKRFFRRFLEADPERVHFAAHSHHPWPDVTFDAHVQSWLDAARFADRKWDRVFSELWPKAQRHVARTLALPDPNTVVFAPNTHELVARVVSAAPAKVPRILTTDGEFHSFARQARRLEESGDAHVVRVPVEPFATFADRFAACARRDPYDVILTSQVFFGSGWALDDDALARIVEAAAERRALVVIDGYHAFLARPTSLAAIADRAFYVAGGYKYAMSGEGTCFLHAPPGYAMRPRDTGWFAAFGALESAEDGVEYAPGGARFLGATFDPTALHRFVAVMDWLEREGVTVAAMHAHVVKLQDAFVRALDDARIDLSSKSLVVPIDEPARGHFLTFERPDAARIQAALLAGNVITDVRGTRLRVGLGVYHDEEDVRSGVGRMAAILR
jgi:selenocysteine lyase/cysteine desulfurase